MSDENFLKQITKGAGLLFAGTFVIFLIKFISRIIISRYLGPSDYGLLSLGDAVLNIAILFATLGLPKGAVKYISNYLALNQQERIKGTIISVSKIVILLSIFISVLMILFSEYIAIGIFHKEELIPIIIIFALAVPFFAFSNTLASIFLAFKKIQYRNYLNAVIRPFSLIIFIIIAILLNGSVYYIAIAYLLSHIVPVFLGPYLLEFKTFPLIKSKVKAIYDYKALFKYSLPLFYSGLFVTIMGWMDTFFLGSLKSMSEVGIYNAILPLVSTLTIFISAFGNIYFPISSELYAKKKFNEISKLYSTISRWTFLLTLPFLLLILTFPKDIIRIIFGSAYELGSIALQILILAYFLKAILGPGTQVLMTFNKTKVLFHVNSIAAIINFFLNFILILKYGLIGAAIATAISLIFHEGTIFLIAKRKLNFSYSIDLYFKYALSAIFPLLFVFVIVKNYFILNIFSLSVISFLYLNLYLFFLIIFRVFIKEDLIVIEAIEKKTKISLKIIKKYIKN